MKFILTTLLRIINIYFVFLGTTFAVNANNMNICTIIPSNTSPDSFDQDLVNDATINTNYAISGQNIGNISSNFTLPAPSAYDQLACKILTADKYLMNTLTNSLQVVEQIKHPRATVYLPTLPAIGLEKCKIILVGSFQPSPGDGWPDTYVFLDTPNIDCNYLNVTPPAKLKK